MTIRDYGLKDLSGVEVVVNSDLTSFKRSLEALPKAWREVKSTGRLDRLVVVRVNVQSYASANYALMQAADFASACKQFLQFGMARAEVKEPVRAALEPDLAVAISLGWREDARFIAGKALAGKAPTENEPAMGLCAHILAAMIDLDIELATKSIELLSALCDHQHYSRRESEIFGRWAEVADAVARRDATSTDRLLSESFDARRVRIAAELTLLKRDKPSEIMATDFWDTRTCALIGIAIDSGVVDRESASAKMAFADCAWTRESGHGRND
jgi:hypothetical protein